MITQRQFDLVYVQYENMDLNKSDLDEFKRIYLETNVYLLAITLFVSILHTLFEFLAF